MGKDSGRVRTVGVDGPGFAGDSRVERDHK
jgi:hypothetical protein